MANVAAERERGQRAIDTGLRIIASFEEVNRKVKEHEVPPHVGNLRWKQDVVDAQSVWGFGSWFGKELAQSSLLPSPRPELPKVDTRRLKSTERMAMDMFDGHIDCIGDKSWGFQVDALLRASGLFMKLLPPLGEQ
jgi:hypothetical protein